MPKLPYMPLYCGDWLKAPELTLCSPATRGIWIDFLCAMHEMDRSGILRGTIQQLSRIARCSTEEMTAAIGELRESHAADIAESNGVVTVTCRRMVRESDERKSTADRQKRHRTEESREKTASVTPLSRSESRPMSRPCADIDIENSKGGVQRGGEPKLFGDQQEPSVPCRFDEFWQAWPSGIRKIARKQCLDKWMTHKCDEVFDEVMRGLDAWKSSDEWKKSGGQYIPAPLVWLNQNRWESGPTGGKFVAAKTQGEEEESHRKTKDAIAEADKRAMDQAMREREARMARMNTGVANVNNN